MVNQMFASKPTQPLINNNQGGGQYGTQQTHNVKTADGFNFDFGTPPVPSGLQANQFRMAPGKDGQMGVAVDLN